MLKIKKSDGKYYDLPTNKAVEDHFKNEGLNYGHTILKQINELNYYDEYFFGKTNLTVLDIGANIGLFSLYCEPSCGRILAFEPTPSHYQKLKFLTTGTKVEPQEIALSNKKGNVQFFSDLGNSTMNSIISNHYGVSIDRKCLALKDIIDEYDLEVVDFCKIDIEGSEMVAITQEIIDSVNTRIKSFFMEVHPTMKLNGKNQQENKDILSKIFKNSGYSVRDINFETIYAEKL